MVRSSALFSDTQFKGLAAIIWNSDCTVTYRNFSIDPEHTRFQQQAHFNDQTEYFLSTNKTTHNTFLASSKHLFIRKGHGAEKHQAIINLIHIRNNIAGLCEKPSPQRNQMEGVSPLKNFQPPVRLRAHGSSLKGEYSLPFNIILMQD